MVRRATHRRCCTSVRRVPLELQNARNECGLACLAMVAGYFDGHTRLHDVRRRFAGHSHGLTLKSLAEFATQLGLASRGVRAEPQDLRRLNTPAVLHWNMDHFVVLVAVKRKGCVIHDPALGRTLCSWKEVGERFTGVVLELWPLESEVDLQDERGVAGAKVDNSPTYAFGLAEILSMVSGRRWQIVWVLILSLMVQIMVLLSPWHVQWTVDEALMSGDTHLIGVLCLGFGLLLLCRVVTHVLRGLLVIYLGHGVSFQLACRLLAHLLRLPLPWFEGRHVGDITSRFSSLQPVRDLLTQGAAAALVDLLMVVLSLALMFVYSPTLAGLVLAVHVGFTAVHICFVPRLKRFAMGMVVTQATEHSHLLESIRSIHNVKVYNQEPQRLDQWQRRHVRTLSASMSMQRTQLGIGSAAMLISGAELIALVYLVSHKVLDGGFSLGMLFAFLSYRGHFTERLRGLVEQLVGMRTLQVHLQRLGEIWCETPESLGTSRSSAANTVVPKGSLDMCAVYYRHSLGTGNTTGAGSWVLAQLDLSVAEGEFVAIIGASGGGKTTLLKLLMGLISPSQGRVEWGGHVVESEVAAALRARSGCVLQGDAFFTGSVAENISFFDELDIDRLEHCLAAVRMLDVLQRMPMRYNTQVGDIGLGLSSGQMQRLLLARALYRDPQFLFLDEGTANLDTQSAALIYDLVKNLACTRIVVTHDLGFAACADRVVQLVDGGLRPVSLAAKNAVVASAG